LTFPAKLADADRTSPRKKRVRFFFTVADWGFLNTNGLKFFDTGGDSSGEHVQVSTDISVNIVICHNFNGKKEGIASLWAFTQAVLLPRPGPLWEGVEVKSAFLPRALRIG
jgi:hypothetical protein